jgi:hypothetical protein
MLELNTELAPGNTFIDAYVFNDYVSLTELFAATEIS